MINYRKYSIYEAFAYQTICAHLKYLLLFFTIGHPHENIYKAKLGSVGL